MSGIVSHVYVKSGHGEPMVKRTSVIAHTGKGLVGDASYGRNKRQVLLVEKEALDEYGLVPGQVRENITVSGIVLAGIPQGTKLLAGDVLLEVTGDCAPCRLIEGIQPGLQAAMAGRRGTLCRVIEGGTISLGDRLQIQDGSTH